MIYEIYTIKKVCSKILYYNIHIKAYRITCSRCFSPSSSSVSCDTVVGLPKGAMILEGKGKGLFTATGTSIGFCCGSWIVGDGADTSALGKSRCFWYIENANRRSYIDSETEDTSPTCKGGGYVGHGKRLQYAIRHGDMHRDFAGIWGEFQRWLTFSGPLRQIFCPPGRVCGQRLCRNLGL